MVSPLGAREKAQAFTKAHLISVPCSSLSPAKMATEICGNSLVSQPGAGLGWGKDATLCQGTTLGGYLLKFHTPGASLTSPWLWPCTRWLFSAESLRVSQWLERNLFEALGVFLLCDPYPLGLVPQFSAALTALHLFPQLSKTACLLCDSTTWVPVLWELESDQRAKGGMNVLSLHFSLFKMVSPSSSWLHWWPSPSIQKVAFNTLCRQIHLFTDRWHLHCLVSPLTLCLCRFICPEECASVSLSNQAHPPCPTAWSPFLRPHVHLPKMVFLNNVSWCDKTLNDGSSHHGAAETNLTRNHEVEGSIPGLTQWVKDPALPWAVV